MKLLSIKEYTYHAGYVSTLIDKFCSPLKEYGLRFFSYSKIDKNSNLVYLSSNPLYNERKLHHTIFDGYHFVYDLVGQGFQKYIFTGTFVVNDNSVHKTLYEFGYWNSIDFYQAHEDYIEIFYFAGHKDDPTLLNYCINFEPYFHRFIAQFKWKFRNLITTQQWGIKIDDSFKWDKHLITADLKEGIARKEKFITSTGFSKVLLPESQNGKSHSLTYRQLQILHFLAKGRSIKSIALKLNISPRTIDDHLNSIKNKFNLIYKQDLLDFFEANNLDKILI